ncbi:TonB-dependent receptor plug domain-containing protein [Ideonella livida]|uniref:TonB-dependent receptor n=1 Tax=Ideonella livida TaxID=2707176 RepID=A0A7C9PFA9_9BURK|nr:TonB-dependent receptor [Ideonella livida]NDY90453.1 TonB-dependent receptor [Ideonella livida]
MPRTPAPYRPFGSRANLRPTRPQALEVQIHACPGRALAPLILTVLAPHALCQAPAEPVQQVEVRGNANSSSAQRRADVAGQQVVTRQELLQHGDTRLADALRRVPGVSVDHRGQGTEVKLGGLGNGYTRLLINGEPAPPGFTLDSLPLDSLERVEILRGASVQTAQAIAGTVNLVTRSSSKLATRDFKLSAATQWGQPQAQASVNLGNAWGLATWGLGLVASSERQRWPAEVVQQRREDAAEGSGSATVTQRYATHKREDDRTDALAANPRWSWKQGDGDGGQWQASLDHSLRYARSHGGSRDQREPLVGPPPDMAADDMRLNFVRRFWRGRQQLQHQTADGTLWQVRLSFNQVRRDQDSHVDGWNAEGTPVKFSDVDGRATDQTLQLTLVHQRPLGEDHRLDLGLEREQARRRESRVQTELALPGGLPAENLDERYDAHATRHAVYLQDDWALSPRTQAVGGVRLEQLSTHSSGNVFETVRQTHQLVGPVLRLSTTPAGDVGVFKLGLSRGFKLPQPRDVMPRRYVNVETTPLTPANMGNPDLKPERAWSLDGSWQRGLPGLGGPGGQGGEVVVSGALRRIQDVILDRLQVRPDDAVIPWVLERYNAGRAWAASLELELRGQARAGLAGWLPGATGPLRWQTSLGVNRSRLRDVVAEHPALPNQPRWVAKGELSQDFGPQWQTHAGLEARGPALADLPSGRRQAFDAQQALNADVSWLPAPRQRLRLAATTLAASDEVERKRVALVEDGRRVTYDSREAWQRQTLWRLSWESGF